MKMQLFIMWLCFSVGVFVMNFFIHQTIEHNTTCIVSYASALIAAWFVVKQYDR